MALNSFLELPKECNSSCHCLVDGAIFAAEEREMTTQFGFKSKPVALAYGKTGTLRAELMHSRSYNSFKLRNTVPFLLELRFVAYSKTSNSALLCLHRALLQHMCAPGTIGCNSLML
jgi:hypothetical protein